jgi:predicted membrane protein
MGAGQVELDLTGPRKSDLNVDIRGGVGQATIRLPRDVGVSARASGGLGSINAGGLEKDGDEYRNSVYGKTPHKIRLNVEGGIGEIELIEE